MAFSFRYFHPASSLRNLYLASSFRHLSLASPSRHFLSGFTFSQLSLVSSFRYLYLTSSLVWLYLPHWSDNFVWLQHLDKFVGHDSDRLCLVSFRCLWLQQSDSYVWLLHSGTLSGFFFLDISCTFVRNGFIQQQTQQGTSDRYKLVICSVYLL